MRFVRWKALVGLGARCPAHARARKKKGRPGPPLRSPPDRNSSRHSGSIPRPKPVARWPVFYPNSQARVLSLQMGKQAFLEPVPALQHCHKASVPASIQGSLSAPAPGERPRILGGASFTIDQDGNEPATNQRAVDIPGLFSQHLASRAPRTPSVTP